MTTRGRNNGTLLIRFPGQTSALSRWLTAGCLLIVFIVILFSVASWLTKLGVGWMPSIGDVTAGHDNTEAARMSVANRVTSLSSPPAYPLKISTNGRYLVDQNNQPFFLSGDAAWSLIAQLTVSDVDYYLSNRQQKGFNTVLVNLLEHQFATYAPRNIYGDTPFTGQVFTTPNEAYFSHADYVISTAAQKGINVLLAPLYLGYNCGSDGWCSDVQAATIADLQFWGQYLGNRYKNFDNIIWVVGADTDPSPVKDKVNAFAVALQQADGRHLITAGNQPETMAVTPWSGASWLTLNNVYSYSLTLYQFGQAAYNLSPNMPFFLLESAYENEHDSTDQERRAQTYWTVLSGGFGHVFGNCPIWHFGSTPSYMHCDQQTEDWKSSLDKQGSVNMMIAQELFNSLSWQDLVPDWDHTTLIAGYNTWEWGQTDYATAARTSDGSLVVVYMPTNRTITIDMTRLSASATARWYDPANGVYSTIPGSPFSNTGSQRFVPPGNNSEGSSDWVLVLKVDSIASPTLTSTFLPTATRTNTVQAPTSTRTNTPPGPTASRTSTSTFPPATRTNTPSLPVHTATLTFVFPAPTATSTLPYPTLTSITPPTWTATVFEPPIESTSTNTPISPGSGSSQRILYFVIGMLLTVAIAGTLLYLLWVFRQLSRSR
jgi:hypothetical protein